MKAYVLHDKQDIRYEDVSEPVLAANQVLVKVKAAGICGSDIPRIYVNGAHKMPLIPGHEFAGEVVGCTEETVTWMGKHVGVFPLIPCRKCAPCLQKKYEMCCAYNYLGSRCDGGFAEYVAVEQDNLIEISERVSFQAVAMMEPMAVAVHAMRGIDTKKDDKILVSGLGTIGLLLIMFLKNAGYNNIVAIGNKDLQREKVLELGLRKEDFCDIRTEDVSEWIRNRTNNLGVDTFFECVGTGESISAAISATAPAGKIMMVGNPASDILLNQNIYWNILRHQLTVRGSWNSSFLADESDDWHYVKRCLENGEIHPEKLITHNFSLEELKNGFRIMRDKSEEYVKIMADLA